MQVDEVMDVCPLVTNQLGRSFLILVTHDVSVSVFIIRAFQVESISQVKIPRLLTIVEPTFVFTAIYGCVWELLQWLSILGGTGDYLDIIMYLLASILCLIINLKERKV